MLGLTEDSRTTDFALGWFWVGLTEDSRYFKHTVCYIITKHDFGLGFKLIILIRL